jgi:hypothetical protein
MVVSLGQPEGTSDGSSNLDRQTPSCSHSRPSRAVHAFVPLPVWFASFALLAVLAVLGTERLGRPFTDDEKRRLGALLAEHDYPGARLVALRFAFRLTRNRERAKDLMGRTDLRLVTYGWDPARVTLVKALCRLVWSEWTHSGPEAESARRAEEGFLREVSGGMAVPSVEQRAITAETEASRRTKGAAQIEKLRAIFEEQKDEVNLFLLKRALEGENDFAKLAKESGRDVAELYLATKRRRRAVQRLLANDRGVDSGGDPL